MKNSPNTGLYQFPYLLLTLAVFFWSGNFIVGRAVRADIMPIALSFWRWSGASLLVIWLAWPHLKSDVAEIRRSWPILLLLAIIGIALFNTLIYTGLQRTIALNGLLMQSMMPVLIVAMSFLFFREKISLRQTVGIMLSLVGALVIIVKGDMQVLLSLSMNPGDIAIFCAVACYAAYSVLLRKRPPIHPLSFLAATFAAGALLLLPFYVWETLVLGTMRLNRATLLAVGYVVVFPSIVSFFCFNRGVELVGANRAGLFLHLMPVFGSIMAVVFLGESLRWFHGVGVTLIAAGIFLATRRDRMP